MRSPANLLYTKDHIWLRMDQGLAMIGITEFAQYEIGDISSVRVEESNRLLLKGEVFGTLAAESMVFEMRMPVTGSILELNPLLSLRPAVVNRDPYGEGWIAKLKVKHAEEPGQLMHALDYMSGW